MISPLPCAPPSALMCVMRSIISMLSTGNCALPGPNRAPCPQAMSSSLLKECWVDGSRRAGMVLN